MKYTYKKKMTSFEILENSFGGNFPDVIELENPPNFIVKIVEDSFLQNLIKIFSVFKHSKKIYSFLYNLLKKALGQLAETKNINSIRSRIFITFISAIMPAIFFPKYLIRTAKRSPYDIYGYVSPMKKNYIYLCGDAIKKDSHDVNKTLGHENIHVLQLHHGDLDFDKRYLDIESVDHYCKLFLNAEVKHQRLFRYLFQKVEVEARVHELVSAFYIETQYFPITRKEFLVCLLYSNGILKHLKLALQVNHSNPKNIQDLLDEIKNHAVVMSIHSPITIPTHVTDDFSCLLFDINNTDELFNFISFKLPIYYSNVLKLYGSNSASSKLRNEINAERQLYDLKPTDQRNQIEAPPI